MVRKENLSTSYFVIAGYVTKRQSKAGPDSDTNEETHFLAQALLDLPDEHLEKLVGLK